MQSKPLAAAVDGNFLEATTGEVDLQEDDPKILDLMLQFMYTGTYDDKRIPEKPSSAGSTTSDLKDPSNPNGFTFGSTQPATAPVPTSGTSSIFGGSPATYPAFPPTSSRSSDPSAIFAALRPVPIGLFEAKPTPLSNQTALFGSNPPSNATPFRSEALIINSKVYSMAEQCTPQNHCSE